MCLLQSLVAQDSHAPPVLLPERVALLLLLALMAAHVTLLQAHLVR